MIAEHKKKPTNDFDDLVGDDDKFPVEETSLPDPAKKIEALPHGWQILTPEQQTGKAYLVSHVFDGAGVLAFWRRTRRLSHNRWVLHGRWSDSLTRVDIIPQPLYYKEIS